MTTISDKDRAEAQAMFEAFHGGAPIALSDGSVRRWLAVRDHVLAAHECPTVPVWRPVIDGEDLTGYEVRSRGRDRDVWHAWGVAHRRNTDGGWVSAIGWLLTGWTYETTAPLPEPEPWPDELVKAAVAVMADAEAESDDREDEARAVLDLLAARYPGVRAAIAGGEQA